MTKDRAMLEPMMIAVCKNCGYRKEEKTFQRDCCNRCGKSEMWEPCLSQTRKETEMKIHKSVTSRKVIAACQRRNTSLDNPGFCIACGNEQEGCEPDAREYECEACGERKVYGAEELLIMMA